MLLAVNACQLLSTNAACILVLQEYASTLRQARRMGSIANMMPGVNSAGMTDSLKLYESIIG